MPGWSNTVGVRVVLVLIINRMWSRLATTRIIAASLNVHALVGVLSLPVRGAHQASFLHTLGNIASCRTRAAKSRSELVIPHIGLPKLTRVPLECLLVIPGVIHS